MIKNNKIKMKKIMRSHITVLMLLLSVVFLSTNISAKPDFIYMAELNLRSGYHLFGQSESWLNGKSEMLKNDIFFQDETSDVSNNVSTEIVDNRMGMPFFSLEWIMGLKLNELPFLGDVPSLKGFRGFRVGFGFTYYAMTKMEEDFYSGEITYTNINATAQDVNYNGTISFSEEFFMYAPGITLYYFHEDGIGQIKELLPYVGIHLGLNIVSGERKLFLDTDAVVASDGQEYQADARIQEVFYNAISFRTGITFGLQYYFGGSHNIDISIGFIYNETSVPFERTGTWNTKIAGNPYSRIVSESEKNSTFSQTGFSFSIGYSVGLF